MMEIENERNCLPCVADISVLPEGCISDIVSLSLTSPKEACRVCAVSRIFRAAAESNAVWERFLPSDYQAIIARSSSSLDSFDFSSKKHLYLSLSDNPILIDDNKKIKTNMGKTHSSHPEHGLELKNYRKPYTCDGCKENGFGKRYRCEECDYDLHEDCMFNKSTTTHKFFKESTFKFYDKPPRKCDKINCNECKRYCDACGKHIKGFIYHCDEKGWDLHPCCRNLKNELKIDGVKFHLSETVSKCSWCNQKKIKDSLSKIKGWSYVSACDTYHFHVYCAMEMVIEGWKNETTNSNDCLVIENLELPIQRQLNRNGGRGNKYWRIAKIFLKTVVSILLGDPTIILGSLVDLVSK